MMAAELLAVWEQGETRQPLDRALLLLSVAEPETPWQSLAELSIGDRDTRLLVLRQDTLSTELNGFVACPKCAESLEFRLSTTELRHDTPRPDASYTLRRQGYSVQFRLPNSHDLATALQSSDPQEARWLLLEHCVTAKLKGKAAPVRALPKAVLAALETRMAELDPQAELRLKLSCPACSHGWLAALDIGEFFWTELRSEAQKLLQAVHLLASAYGWSESVILALSPERRQAYLSQVLA